MPTLTPKNAYQIKDTIVYAAQQADATADLSAKYNVVLDAYNTVRTLQGATEETDYGETPRAAMEEYLADSLANIGKILNDMEAAAVGSAVIPSPLTDGIVFVPVDGSGS